MMNDLKVWHLFVLIPFLIMVIIYIPPPRQAKAALSEAGCASLVVAEIQAVNPNAQAAQLTPYWTGICKGILNHIKANGQVLTTIPGGSSAGAYTGVIQ